MPQLLHCHLCDDPDTRQEFGEHEDLAKHYYAFHNAIYSCTYCSFQYTSKSDQLHHLEKDHISKPKFRCVICGIFARRKKDMSRHQKDEHRNLNELQCGQCKNVFPNAVCLRIHKEFCSKSGNAIRAQRAVNQRPAPRQEITPVVVVQDIQPSYQNVRYDRQMVSGSAISYENAANAQGYSPTVTHNYPPAGQAASDMDAHNGDSNVNHDHSSYIAARPIVQTVKEEAPTAQSPPSSTQPTAMSGGIQSTVTLEIINPNEDMVNKETHDANIDDEKTTSESSDSEPTPFRRVMRYQPRSTTSKRNTSTTSSSSTSSSSEDDAELVQPKAKRPRIAVQSSVHLSTSSSSSSTSSSDDDEPAIINERRTTIPMPAPAKRDVRTKATPAPRTSDLEKQTARKSAIGTTPKPASAKKGQNIFEAAAATRNDDPATNDPGTSGNRLSTTIEYICALCSLKTDYRANILRHLTGIHRVRQEAAENFFQTQERPNPMQLLFNDGSGQKPNVRSIGVSVDRPCDKCKKLRMQIRALKNFLAQTKKAMEDMEELLNDEGSGGDE